MAFNAGREFNKFASTQGAGFFGALPKKQQAHELRMAGNALNNLTRYKSALEGIELAEREGSRNRSAARTNAIFGACWGCCRRWNYTRFNFGGGGGARF